MASQEEDNKLECISNVNKEQERYYLTVYKKYDSILNDKSENFEKKVTSLIDVWGSISELNLSQFDIRYVIQIIDWAKLHALNIVLTGEWRNTKESCRNSLLESIEKAQTSLASVNDAFSSRCHKLADVVKKPWENPVLKTLIQEKDVDIGAKEIEFFCVETAYLVSVRLKKLCENHCEDLALNLVTNFLKYKKLATEKNFNLNATETQLWFIFDIYVALLYKFQDKSKIVEQFEDLKLEEGLLLIKRFAKKRVKISKIWRNCQKIAIFGSRFFMSRTLLKYTEDHKAFLIELLKTYLTLSNNETLLQEFVVSVRNITNLADAASLCVICDFIHREAADKLRVFAVEMYIRALTTDMNELERLKHVNEDDKVKSTTSRLAKTFTSLADLLDDHVKVARECVLTAFSLEPTKDRLKKIENLAKRSGFPVLDTGQEWKCRLHPPVLPSDDLAWVCPECGEWMCKPELTAPLQMNMALHEALQESVLGISEALCDDLVVCLSNPRYQILSWLLSWGDLYRLCILYLNDPEKTKNFVTELKFVDVDYSMFEHIKREPVDEYTGIEKGYEQYLDLDFVSDEETSSISEDSMSHEKIGLGSDGTGEPYLSLPQAKSDPVTLKSLRMFRPNLKRKKDESDAPTADINIPAPAVSSSSSLGSYLTSSQYNPQTKYSTGIFATAKSFNNSHIINKAPPSSVSLPKVTRQNAMTTECQVSPANSFIQTSRNNFDQVISRIPSSFNSNVNLNRYSVKRPEVRKTVNLSMSASAIVQPESSVFNATNLTSASSTSYVSNIIKSNLSYGVPKVTVSNSSYASTISNKSITNSHDFGHTSIPTSQKNTSPDQRSLASHRIPFQKDQHVTNSAVPDLDALLNEIETNNKYETDPKNGVAATLLQLGGQVAKNQKQSIQVPHQSNLSQIPMKLPQETSLPIGTTEECKTRLRNSNKPYRLNLCGEILDQMTEPPFKLRKLSHESNNLDKVSLHGKTIKLTELQVKIPKLNLEKYNKQGKLSQIGKILDKTVSKPKSLKAPPTIQLNNSIKATIVPTNPLPGRLAPSKTSYPSEMCQQELTLSVPLIRCNPQLFSKPEHLTHHQDKSLFQTEILAAQARYQANKTVEQESTILHCQKEQSCIPQEQQKAIVHSAMQLQQIHEPQSQLKVVINREHYLAPERLESAITIPSEQTRIIISQALPQQHQDSKYLTKEPVSEPHSASISLVKNQECPETTITSLSLQKVGTRRPLKLSSQFTDREPISQKKSQTTCTLADSPKTITPTMDCDKDKKVQTDNQKTDIEMTEVEDGNCSNAEGNNNQCISQVSLKKAVRRKVIHRSAAAQRIREMLLNHSPIFVKCKRTKKVIKRVATKKIKTHARPILKQQKTKPILKQICNEQENNVSIIEDSILASDKIILENEINVEEVEGSPKNTYFKSNNNDIIALTEKINETSDMTLTEYVNTLININRNMDCDITEKSVQINIETKETASSEIKSDENKEEESLAAETKLNTKEEEVENNQNVNKINEKVSESEETTKHRENTTTGDLNALENLENYYSDKTISVILKTVETDEECKNNLDNERDNIEHLNESEKSEIDAEYLHIESLKNITLAHNPKKYTMKFDVSTVDEIADNIFVCSQEVIKLAMLESTYYNSIIGEEKCKVASRKPFQYAENAQNYCGEPTFSHNTSNDLDKYAKSPAIQHTSERLVQPETSPVDRYSLKHLASQILLERRSISEHLDKHESSLTKRIALENLAHTRYQTSPEKKLHTYLPMRRLSFENMEGPQASPTNQCFSKHLVSSEISPPRHRSSTQLVKREMSPSPEGRSSSKKHISRRDSWLTKKLTVKKEPTLEYLASPKSLQTNIQTSEHLSRHETSLKNEPASEHLAICETSPAKYPPSEHIVSPESSPTRLQTSKHLARQDISVENKPALEHLAISDTSTAINPPWKHLASPERSWSTNQHTFEHLARREVSLKNEPASENLASPERSPPRLQISEHLARHEISVEKKPSSEQLAICEISPVPSDHIASPESSLIRRQTYMHSPEHETSLENEPTSEHLTICETSPARREHSSSPESLPRQQVSEQLARPKTSPAKQQASEQLEIPTTSHTKQPTSKHLAKKRTSLARQHLARRKIVPARYQTSPKKQHLSKVAKRKTTSAKRQTSKPMITLTTLPAKSPARNGLVKPFRNLKFRTASASPSVRPSSKLQIDFNGVLDEYCTQFTDNKSSSRETDKENILSSSDDNISNSDSSEDLYNEDGGASSAEENGLPNQPTVENQMVRKYSNTCKTQHDVPCFKVDQERYDDDSETEDFEAKDLSVVLKRLPSNVTNQPPGPMKLTNRGRFEKSPQTASILHLQERLRERIKNKANAPICILYNKEEKAQPLLDFNIRNQMNQTLMKKKQVKQKEPMHKSHCTLNVVKKGHHSKKKPNISSILKNKSKGHSSQRFRNEKHVHFNPSAQVFLINQPSEETASAKSLLDNVPGLHDFSEVRPRNTEQVVNVVQVSGARSSTVTNQNTQTSTQVTPHIQRIGQPKPEPKSDRSEDRSDQSSSSSATTSRELMKPTSQASTLTFGGQIKPGQKSSGTARQTPHINILSQQILKHPNKSSPNLPRPCSNQHKNAWNTTPPPEKDAFKTATVKVEPEDNTEVRASKPTSTNVKIVTSTTQSCGAAATATSSSQGGTILQFICKTSSLPKFQQAFGKTVYQTNNSNEGSAEPTTAPTSENLNQTATVVDTKKISTKAVPVNVQPITGNVIFRGQVPVGQTVSLIPPGSNTRQLFRITGSTHEQISLVKETVIQNKMSALLAAALQGKPKITEQNGELVEEYSATRITLCRPGTVPPNATRIVKPVQLQIPANVIRAPQPNVSSTTLEQLREFDMVYKQVKERSSNPSQPETIAQTSQESSQQQRISFTYVNQVQKYTQLSPVVVVSSYSPLQQTVSPSLTVTSQSGSGTCLTQVSTVAVPKVTVKTSKGKNIKSSATKTSPTAVPTIPKPQQKPQEDEHTTQRIFDILAEYAEQLRNSPDLNNKPAPRRRSNPPTNPSSSTSGSNSSKKKKKKSSSSTTSNMVETDNEDLTMGSEDSSGGNIVQLSMTDEEQSQSASITPPETNLEPATSNTTRPLIMTDTSNQPRNVIIADSSVGEALKMPNTTLIMPGSYIMPVSVVKGGQQIAVVSGGSKILTTVPARSGQNMLLFQSFVNQNKKGAISTVKYSTIQPFSSISSQNVARVSPQPSVMLPSNSVATMALGQPITLKKFDDSERGSNTELLLTISQPRESVKVEQSPEIPQPDSSTGISNEAIEVKIEEGSQSDSSSNEVFNTIQKTNSVATSVIASVVKKEHDDQSDNSTDVVDTSIVKEEEPVKQVDRIGSVLVNASTSNGPMLSHTNPRYRKAPENVESTTAPIKEFSHNVSKGPPPGTKIFKNNAVYYAIRTKKTAGKKIDSEMQKQAAMEREIRLQKSLSEECEDLGVDEPSTSDLFPEADLLFDSNHSPSYDHAGQRIQGAEGKAKASMNLFSDDENSGPMRNDLFDYVEYHPAQAGVDQMNGNNASNESASSCDDTTLLPNCGTMSEVTLNSPISPEYTDSSHAVNKYKYKYTNRKRGEKAVRCHSENWSEVTSTEDAIEIAREEDTPIAIQEETVIDEAVTEIETMVEEKDLTLKCPVHESTDTRGSRKNVKKTCSCFNGSRSLAPSTVKRRGGSPKCREMPTPSKKPLLSKKR